MYPTEPIEVMPKEGLWFCHWCGAVLYDAQAHRTWHKNLDLDPNGSLVKENTPKEEEHHGT